MKTRLESPALVTELARGCRDEGGRALLVGGGVRDFLLGREVHDWDVEVYGLPEDRLLAVLKRLGRVNAVGRSFGVFKLSDGPFEFDVSMPRRDSKVGAGHRGIQVEGDPTMSIEEAARRRDLTVNALLADPLTGEILDPWNGRTDLKNGVLRAVDPQTFLEDPLRALRVVQFAARLGFHADPSLVELCRQAALAELPAERIQGEWLKLLLKGTRPSLGLDIARRAGILERVFPEAVDRLLGDAALDALATGPRDTLAPEGRRLGLMLATWLHATPGPGVEATLDRLWLHKWKGYPLRERVLATVATWQEDPKTDADLRHLSTRTELDITLLVRAHVEVGSAASLALRDRATTLGILHDPPVPLLKGRHSKAIGVAPGPRLGEVLREVYRLQLDGQVTTEAQAIEAALRIG